MSHRTLLAIILFAALSVRLAWGLSRPVDDASIDQLPDQREYLEVARSFIQGDGFGFQDPRFTDRVFAFRTPGYPLFLAGCGANIRAARAAQALVDTLTVLGAFLLARRWLPPGACVFAALLVAFNPFLIYFSGLLLTETLFTAMLTWGLMLITASATLPWLAGGAILALSVLIRPGAIGLPLLIGILATMAASATNRAAAPAYHRRWRLPVGSSMLLLTALALLPWAIRNHRVVGEWIWTSTNSGITSYDGFNPNATGVSDQSFVAAMPQLRNMSETERDHYLGDQASAFVREHPLQSMQLAVAKVMRTWSPRPLSTTFSNPLYVAAALAFAIPFDVLILLGLLRGRLPWTVKLVLSAPAIYLTAAAAASVGSLRYRIPAEVPISVVAASVLTARSRSRTVELAPSDQNLAAEPPTGASAEPIESIE